MTNDDVVLAISGSSSTELKRRSLQSEGLREASDLEQWIVEHPSVLGDDVLIVTTQFGRWQNNQGEKATERLDILGVDSSGQPVVVELKRGMDSRVHLQAITYAAMVASFSIEQLAEAHASFLNRRGEAAAPSVTVEEAEQKLRAHVAEYWSEELLTRPKIILLAEAFLPQTFTTVAWLVDMAPQLDIELRTVQLFASPDLGKFAVFRRLFPALDLENERLLPESRVSTDSVSQEIAKRKRRQNSVFTVVDYGLVPEGGELSFDPTGFLAPEYVERIRAWCEEDPSRGKAVWRNDRNRPLEWQSAPGEYWSPTRLAGHIASLATNDEAPLQFSGPASWYFKGRNLYLIAIDHESEAGA